MPYWKKNQQINKKKRQHFSVTAFQLGFGVEEPKRVHELIQRSRNWRISWQNEWL